MLQYYSQSLIFFLPFLLVIPVVVQAFLILVFTIRQYLGQAVEDSLPFQAMFCLKLMIFYEDLVHLSSFQLFINFQELVRIQLMRRFYFKQFLFFTFCYWFNFKFLKVFISPQIIYFYFRLIFVIFMVNLLNRLLWLVQLQQFEILGDFQQSIIFRLKAQLQFSIDFFISVSLLLDYLEDSQLPLLLMCRLLGQLLCYWIRRQLLSYI